MAIETLRLDPVQQSIRCHREPLFLAPTGLAVGLAPKELRYGSVPIRPWARRPLRFPRSLCEQRDSAGVPYSAVHPICGRGRQAPDEGEIPGNSGGLVVDREPDQ